MKNKVDIFTADYGHREPTKKDDHADEPDPNGRKLPQITDPIRGHERINVQNYLKMFLLFTSDMKLMFSGNSLLIRFTCERSLSHASCGVTANSSALCPLPTEDHPEKAHTSNFLRLLSWLVRGFLLLIFIRGVLLAFNDHDATAYYLGHKSENDAWKHITMITIVWSLYTFLIYNWAFISHRHQHRNLSWLEPFQVICGMKPAIEFGLSREMLDKLLKRSRYVFYTSLFFAFVRSFFGLFIFFFLYNYNFEYVDEQEMIGTIWIFILTFWIFFNSGAAYIISACYDILCYYFKIRFKKVNADIARLIDPNRPLEAKERHGLLFTILHEHNHLCQKIDEYNVFWSRYVLYTYFAVPFVSLYTLYQVIFVNHTSEAIIVMWVHFCNLWRFAYQ